MRELKFSKLYVAVYGGGYPNKKILWLKKINRISKLYYIDQRMLLSELWAEKLREM